MDDIEHVSLERLARQTTGPMRRFRTFVWSAVARVAERRIVAASSCVLVCSEIDRRKLMSLCPAADIAIAANTATEFGDLPLAETPTVMFVGIAIYPPNREAILWLVNEIWPLVMASVPDARLLVVGEGSENLGIAKDGIEVLGFLPDLEGVYRAARLVVCPVRRGGGTRIKIIEAALNGRPVVSTTVGAEGLLFDAGSEILLADEAPDFARRCIEILGHPTLAMTVGIAARRRAQALYSQARVKADLVALCREYVPASRHR